MKRTLRNLFGITLLLLAMAASQIPVELSEAAQDSSDFQLDGTTLVKYTGTAYAVSVPDEVEIIGEEAFSGNNNIKVVRLPDKLESIEYGAFSYCNALNKIDIPDSVESIGSGAFACCTSLSTVEIGSGVKEMGTGVFAGCISLKNISMDSGNESFLVDKGALYDKEITKLYQYCPGRKDYIYNMPDSVESIGKYAFWGCQSLETVALNNNIGIIDGYAFSNCRSLKTIEIPYAVSSIGAKAFEDCISLTEADLPVSLQYIHDTAFDGCINLVLTGPEDSVAGDYAVEFNQKDKSTQAEYEDIFDAIIPSDDAAQPGNNDAFSEDNTVQNDNIDNKDELGNMLGSTAIVGNQAVVFIDNTSSQVYDGSDRVFQNIVGTDGEVTINGPQNQMGELQNSGSKYDGKGIHIPKYKIYHDTIVDQAYYKNRSLTDYEISKDITEIGDFAFARSGLTSIFIPEGVTKIGYGAFYHCDNLNQVSLPTTIEDIEPEAFEETGFIENWKKSGSSEFLTAGNGILLAYNGDESTVNVPDGVRIIAPGVFANRPGITAVVLPDSLIKICEGAFEGCTRLKQISGGANVTDIEDHAFFRCPIETIRIPDNIESLGLLTFDLSGVNKRADQKTAVFHGNIPMVTYEETAQRLSNDEYRGRALNGVNYAVINKNINMESLKGTVLDSTSYGFKGVIISIDSEKNMTATVRGTTLTGEELAYFDLCETVEIYGRQYTLTGIEKLEEFAVNNTEESRQNDGSVLILNKVTDMNTGAISATLSENTDAFYLSIEESKDAYDRIANAFIDIYDMNPPMSFVAYDISLFEEESNVRITKLGRQSLKVTMPLPKGLESGTLFIMTTDADGQLEDVPYWYVENENERKVTFEVNHLSDFGFYTSGTTTYAEGEASKGKAVIGSYSQKDDSPNTGDLIHPKWFLVCGLFFAAMAAFFVKRKPVKIT